MIKIVSDGSVTGTKVIDMKTGSTLGGISGIKINIDADQRLVTCDIRFVDVKLDMIVEKPEEK